MISIPIPAGAGPGDLIVKIPGGTTGRELSNTFPFDTDATIGNIPGGVTCFPNSTLAAEFVSDPVISDVGGDVTSGPKINDVVEVFDVSLDCSGLATSGIYSIILRGGAGRRGRIGGNHRANGQRQEGCQAGSQQPESPATRSPLAV